jgi:hypothetical protein
MICRGKTCTDKVVPKLSRFAIEDVQAAPALRPESPRARKKWLVLAAARAGVLIATALIWRFTFRAEPPVFQLARVERGRIDATGSD